MTNAEIFEKYERELVLEQERASRYVERQYVELAGRIAPILAADLPRRVREQRVNELLEDAYERINIRIEKGVSKAWELSNQRTTVYLDKKLANITLPDKVKRVIYDPNEKALRSFLERKRKGLTLSDRVWNTVQGVNERVETLLEEGISKGEGAAKVGRRLRKELRNPTGSDKPGQGVYKSPIKNTQRLTRTETNRSYRRADHEAWGGSPLYLGYQIKLSATQSKKVKVRCEICRGLAGVYPLDFVWDGWHP